MRARYPDVEDVVVRDGVRIGYEVYGSGAPTILLPTSNPIVHARQWKAQVPFLARHFRVVVVDGRGNGRSDRPAGTCRLHRRGGRRRPGRRARRHRHRPGGGRRAVPRGPARPRPRRRAPGPRDRRCRAGTGGRSSYNWFDLASIRADYPGFVAFFYSRVLTDPHSTKRFEDAVAWSLETTAGRPGRLLHRSGRPDARAGSRAVRRRPLPGARRARHRRPGGTPRDRRRGGRMDRRCAGDRARRRPLAGGARPGEGQPSDPRLRPVRHRRAVAVALVDPGAAPEPSRAVPLLTDRARARPARPRHRRRAAQAASRRGDRLAGPAPRHRGAGGRGRAGAPGVAVAGERVRAHREPRPASTTCTCSRRMRADGRDPARELPRASTT